MVGVDVCKVLMNFCTEVYLIFIGLYGFEVLRFCLMASDFVHIPSTH